MTPAQLKAAAAHELAKRRERRRHIAARFDVSEDVAAVLERLLVRLPDAVARAAAALTPRELKALARGDERTVRLLAAAIAGVVADHRGPGS